MSSKVRFRRVKALPAGLIKVPLFSGLPFWISQKSADWYFGKTYLSFHCSLRKLISTVEKASLQICGCEKIDQHFK